MKSFLVVLLLLCWASIADARHLVVGSSCANGQCAVAKVAAVVPVVAAPAVAVCAPAACAPATVQARVVVRPFAGLRARWLARRQSR